jgi:hypothetical protein
MEHLLTCYIFFWAKSVKLVILCMFRCPVCGYSSKWNEAPGQRLQIWCCHHVYRLVLLISYHILTCIGKACQRIDVIWSSVVDRDASWQLQDLEWGQQLCSSGETRWMDSPTWGTCRHIIFCLRMRSRGAEKPSILEQHKPAAFVIYSKSVFFFFTSTTLYTMNKRATIQCHLVAT